MREYAALLVGMSLAFAVISSVSYKLTDKAVKLGIGIIFLVAVASPLFSLVKDFPLPEAEIEDFDSNIYSEYAEAALCKGITEEIKSRFSLKDGELAVYLVGFSAESMSAEKIKIILSSDAFGKDITAIRRFVEGCGFGECEVIYGFG